MFLGTGNEAPTRCTPQGSGKCILSTSSATNGQFNYHNYIYNNRNRNCVMKTCSGVKLSGGVTILGLTHISCRKVSIILEFKQESSSL